MNWKWIVIGCLIFEVVISILQHNSPMASMLAAVTVWVWGGLQNREEKKA